VAQPLLSLSLVAEKLVNHLEDLLQLQPVI
jgi:hypothetical protein